MATVKIYYEEAADDILPRVCMKCGQPSTTYKRKTFSWCPPWVAVTLLAGLLPYIIIAAILTKRMKVTVPLCDEHRNHWLWRTLVILAGFVVLMAGFFLGVFLSSNQQGGNKAQDDMMGYVCMGSLGFGLIWLIVAVILQNTAIRPKEITEDRIILTSVCEEFSDAMKDERERERERDDDRDERRRPRGRRSRD